MSPKFESDWTYNPRYKCVLLILLINIFQSLCEPVWFRTIIQMKYVMVIFFINRPTVFCVSTFLFLNKFEIFISIQLTFSSSFCLNLILVITNHNKSLNINLLLSINFLLICFALIIRPKLFHPVSERFLFTYLVQVYFHSLFTCGGRRLHRLAVGPAPPTSRSFFYYPPSSGISSCVRTV